MPLFHGVDIHQEQLLPLLHGVDIHQEQLLPLLRGVDIHQEQLITSSTYSFLEPSTVYSYLLCLNSTLIYTTNMKSFIPTPILASFCFFSVLYILIRQLHPFDLDWIIKSIPIFILIAFAAQRLTGATRGRMVLALAFSVTGDILLSLDGLFILGLGAFLVAQLIYALHFATEFKASKRGVFWACSILIYMLISAIFILPNAGDFKVAVVAYITAISAMAITAGFRGEKNYLMVAIGALIFVSSDTLIAINKFVSPLELSGALIMSTYYLAQLMICVGVVRQFQQSIIDK